MSAKKPPITVQTEIYAPLETVWDMWTLPKHIVKWAFASSDWEAPAAKNDVRTGGKFKTVMAAKDKSAQFDFTGVYTKVQPQTLIEYDMPDGRHVQVKFSSTSKSVRVTETFDPETIHPPEAQRQGWQAILENFKSYVHSRYWVTTLKKEGFTSITACPLPPNKKTPEHTHKSHTVHIILNGILTITDAQSTKKYDPGDRVEFPPGTIHSARGSGEYTQMITATKKKKRA